MIMGIIILKKRYDISKYLSVIMITMGIITCTIVSGKDVVGFKKIQFRELRVFNLKNTFIISKTEKYIESGSDCGRSAQFVFGAILVGFG